MYVPKGCNDPFGFGGVKITHPWFPDRGPGSLQRTVNELHKRRYASTSITTLTTKMKKFIVFANLYGFLLHTDVNRWVIPELDPILMTYYAAYLFQNTSIKKIQTLRSYISAVASWCTAQGRTNPTWDPDTQKPHKVFTGVMKAIAKEMGEAPTQRMPITAFHMDILWRNSIQHMEKYRGLNYRVMITLAWYGLLRTGEFTIKTGQQFDPTVHFQRKDIKFYPSIMVPEYFTILIPRSKTDQTRIGSLVKIFTTSTKTCPVTAMQQLFLQVPTAESAPLFNLSGLPTRDKFLKATTTLLSLSNIDTRRLKGHSFRQGGASAALQVAPEWQVKLMGRWKSDAWRLYAFVDNRIIQQTHKAMGQAPLIPGSATGRVIHHEYEDD